MEQMSLDVFSINSVSFLLDVTNGHVNLKEALIIFMIFSVKKDE